MLALASSRATVHLSDRAEFDRHGGVRQHVETIRDQRMTATLPIMTDLKVQPEWSSFRRASENDCANWHPPVLSRSFDFLVSRSVFLRSRNAIPRSHRRPAKDRHTICGRSSRYSVKVRCYTAARGSTIDWLLYVPCTAVWSALLGEGGFPAAAIRCGGLVRR